VLHEGPSSYQNPAFAAALREAGRPLLDGVAHAHRGGLVGLQWSSFLSSLFSLMPSKFTSDLWKNNYVLKFVVLLILTILLLITIYLTFDAFWNLVFFRFHSRHFIQFDFFIWFGPSIFYCSISVFYTFLDYYFFLQSHPLSFYCIYFFNLFFVFILLIAIFL
jgi:hypothetical protein